MRKCSLLCSSIVFFKAEGTGLLGKVYLNSHSTATFHHCYGWVPWLPLYPLNFNMEVSLQCTSSIIVMQTETLWLWNKCTHILSLVGKDNAERWGTVWTCHCIWRVLSKTGQSSIGKKDKALARKAVSLYFPKQRWLETLPTRHGPWNLSRKNLSSHSERVSPVHAGEQIPFLEA